MTEAQFWQIIEARPQHLILSDVKQLPELGPVKRVKYIKKILLTFSPDQLVAFQNIFSSKIRALYLRRVAQIFLRQMPEYRVDTEKATFLSTDGFIDFRAWIITLGKEKYEGILHDSLNYTLIPDILDPDFAYEPALPFLAENILEEKGAVDYIDQIESWYNVNLDLQ